MFALALWDRKERTLLLARDRYGIKPLYISQQGNTFAFGSEQKAILAMSGFQRQLDKPALLEYFTFQNIFTDRTLLEDIQLLQAGSYATLDLKKTRPALRITQYWDFDFREPAEYFSDDEYREELDRLFQQAVNRQLVTDVEIGSYLSGGMDSGSITAIAAKSFPYLKTFTCGFDLNSASGIELAFDERAKAEAMSYHFKTEHYEMVLKAGDMERVLPKLAIHLEEPRVGQSYPNYYAAQLTRKFVKVVLSGAGGDELLAAIHGATIEPWLMIILRTISINTISFGKGCSQTVSSKMFFLLFGAMYHMSQPEIFSAMFFGIIKMTLILLRGISITLSILRQKPFCTVCWW